MDQEKLSERVRGFIQAAQGMALARNHQKFTPEHLLKVLIDDKEGMAAGLAKAAGADVETARAAANGRRDEAATGDDVLHDLSFTVEPGRTLAIVGATGAGKSTLVHLIPRFYDATAGCVAVDGVDVRNIDESLLRRTVGVVLQESILFSGSIRDNIRYGRPDAPEAAVVAAAQAAQAHDLTCS